MSIWPSTRAKRVLAALLRIGWTIKRQVGSHRVLARQGFPDFAFAFPDNEEIGPRMLTRVAKHTGLRPEDLQGTSRGAVADPRRRSRSGIQGQHAQAWPHLLEELEGRLAE